MNWYSLIGVEEEKATFMATTMLQACSFGGFRVVKFQNRNHHSSCHLVTKNHNNNNNNASTFTYTISDHVSLIELPEATFDQYMEEKGRVIRAIMPERATTQHLIQEDWRIKMPSVQALFQTVQPVIDVRLRCKSNGQDYPPHVPPHVTKLYEAHTTKWELQGVHADYMPPYFNFEAIGTLYPERKGNRSIIKNDLQIKIGVVFPPILLAFIPKHVVHNILDTVIKKFMEDVKTGSSARLVEDYRSFKLNKLSKVSQHSL